MTVLVAGIGNLFLGDDGFGPEVVRQLTALPAHARAVDYGIRGMHLAYDLLGGWDALVMVDTLGRTRPGQVTVLEIGPDDVGHGEFDPHGMNPVAVLASLDRLGGTLPPTYLVGCGPANLDEGIGLSAVVTAAVPDAVAVVYALVTRLAAPGQPGTPPSAPAGPTFG